MTDPQDVNQKDFPVTKNEVLYNKGSFSVALSENNGKTRLGARWNEAPKSKFGYPNVWGRPRWFFISDQISIQLLSSLRNEKNIKEDPEKRKKVSDAIKEFHRQKGGPQIPSTDDRRRWLICKLWHRLFG